MKYVIAIIAALSLSACLAPHQGLGNDRDKGVKPQPVERVSIYPVCEGSCGFSGGSTGGSGQ